MYLDIVSDGGLQFSLRFNNVLNAIVGNSSTGKTLLAEIISTGRYKIKDTDAASVIVFTAGLPVNLLRSNTLLIIDLDNFSYDALKETFSINRDDICIVCLGRKFLRNLPLSIYNLYRLETVKGITKNIIYPFTDMLIKQYSKVIVEDSKSGLQFFKNIITNTETCDGNSNVLKYITDSNLIVFDAVGFGGYIEEFIKEINRVNGSYLGYESFEGFLLRELFNDNRIPYSYNIENGLVDMLKEHNPDYTKHTGCTQDSCLRCGLDCKQSSKTLLCNSRYKEVLKFYKQNNIFSKAINKMSS